MKIYVVIKSKLLSAGIEGKKGVKGDFYVNVNFLNGLDFDFLSENYLLIFFNGIFIFGFGLS